MLVWSRLNALEVLLCGQYECEATNLVDTIRPHAIDSLLENLQDDLEAHVHQFNKYELKITTEASTSSHINTCNVHIFMYAQIALINNCRHLIRYVRHCVSH